MACLFLMSAVFFAYTINIFGKIWKGRADLYLFTRPRGRRAPEMNWSAALQRMVRLDYFNCRARITNQIFRPMNSAI